MIMQHPEVKEALLKGSMEDLVKLSKRTDIPILAPHQVPEGANVLHIAAILGYEECVPHLLSRNDIDINEADKALGWTPLMYSIVNNFTEITRMLIKSGKCNVNAQDQFRQRALHMEAQGSMDDITVTEWLLDAKAGINVQDAEGMTAFMRAVQANNINIAKCLYFRGCLTNLSNLHGKTPLHFAAKLCNEELVNWLCGIKCNLNGVDNTFQTPLMVCVRQRKPSHVVFKIMQSLLDAGCFVNAQDCHGNTALLLAMDNPASVKKHHIELLLIAGADPNIYNRESLTPLWQAVYDGPHYSDRVKVIQLLLATNCNLDMSCRGKLLFTSGLSSVYAYENFMSPFEVAMDSGFHVAAKMLAYAGCKIKSDMRYDTAGVSEIPPDLKWFINFSQNPPMLQHTCRLAVRKILGEGPLESKVRRLPLPERIKSYVLLQDLIDD